MRKVKSLVATIVVALKDFKPVELPMRLQARSQPSAPVRSEKCTCGIAFQGFGGDRSSALYRALSPPGRRP